MAITVTVLGGGERSFDTPGRIYLPLTIAFTAFVWFAISRHGKWLAWRPFVFLGRISYPLYLVHVVLGFAGHPLGRGARLEHDRGRCRRRGSSP